MYDPADHEHPGENDEQQIRLVQEQRQHHQHVEQHRQLELIVEAIANLHDGGRPVALAERNVPHLGIAAAQGGEPARAKRKQQHKRERDLNKDRQQDGGGRHDCSQPAGFGATRTNILPKFSPFSRPIRAAGAFSRPSTTSSRYLIFPSLSQADTSRRKSPCRFAKSLTMNPRRVRRLVSTLRISSGSLLGPGGSSVALYCETSPHTGTRANGLSSGSTASNTAPPTFSK